jgi:hypothetical protein
MFLQLYLCFQLRLSLFSISLCFYCLALVGWIDLGSCPNNSVSQKEEEGNQDSVTTLESLAKYEDRWLNSRHNMHLSTVHLLSYVVVGSRSTRR